MKSNNVISMELLSAYEAHAHGIRRTWSPKQYADYAAKLDRLAEAARWFNTHGHQIRHSDECLFWDGEEDDDIGPKCDCGKRVAVNELAAALRDIELESEEKNA